MPELNRAELLNRASPEELIALDYGQKQDLLMMISGRILQLKTELIEVSSRYAALKTEIAALKDAGQFIQSELKATQKLG